MPKAIVLPSLERLNELLNHDVDSGLLFWKEKRSSSSKTNTPAGFLDSYGYRLIKIDGVIYKTHRIIYFISTGIQPEEIDHINRVKDDNRINNLRAATTKQNLVNKGVRRDSVSGARGIRKNKSGKRWQAYIVIENKMINLGTYDEIEDAKRARMLAEVNYFGEFSPIPNSLNCVCQRLGRGG
jgi:hypothetical protein